jgi:hypothetical protein
VTQAEVGDVDEVEVSRREPLTPQGDGEQPLLLWTPVAVFSLLLVGLARHAGLGISDPDTLWHILAGRHLWRSGQFAGPDPLSEFTTVPWVLNQWLPELAMALANHLGGLGAVAWLFHLARVALCLVLYKVCRERSGPLAAAVATGVALLGTADNLSPRPQLVGFILLAITVGGWLRTAEDGEARWWLVGVAWLWACSHGTWVVGLSVGVAVTAGWWLEHRQQPRRALRMALVPGLSALAALLTPLGPRLLDSFVTVRAISPYIQEWRQPTLDGPAPWAALAIAVVPPILWLARRRRTPWASVLLWVMALAWALSAARTVAVGVVIVAPLAASALHALLGRVRSPVGGGERASIAAATLLSLAVAAVLAHGGPRAPTDVPDAFEPILSSLPT